MKYFKLYEKFSQNSVLIVVDVQKSFKKFFTPAYVNELKKYCKNFGSVYQIWDNHVDGKNVDKDYLYDENPDIPVHDDLYHFPNQKDLIEKRYNYDVDADFYKKILSKETYEEIKSKEGSLQKGNYFPTTEGTIIVYIGNNHQWYHVPKKLYNLFMKLKSAQSQSQAEEGSPNEIVIVGGADSECLEDVIVAAEALGLQIKRNWKYIYSATHCPIK